jgi:hypothetical protein
MTISEKLKKLYREMADLTKPRCANDCRLPLSCCSPEYCGMAMEVAKEWGETLEPTSHPRLPLMGETGCVAPPHTRPLCTLHVCEGTLLRSDTKWYEQYWRLRERINKLEYARQKQQ